MPPDRRGITQIRCVEGFYKRGMPCWSVTPAWSSTTAPAAAAVWNLRAMGRSVALVPHRLQLLHRQQPHRPPDDDLRAGQSGCLSPVPAALSATAITFRSMMNQGISIGVGEIEAALSNPERLTELHAMFAELERIRDLYAGGPVPTDQHHRLQPRLVGLRALRPCGNRAAVVCFRREECPFEASGSV